MSRPLLLLLLPLVACTWLGGGESDDDDDDDDEGSGGDTGIHDTGPGTGSGGGSDTGIGGGSDTGIGADAGFSDYIYGGRSVHGDFTGYPLGYAAAGAWLDTPTASDTGGVVVELEVVDFETGVGIAGAQLESWNDDRVSGPADGLDHADQSGRLDGFLVPRCSPITVTVSTDPSLGETKPTHHPHRYFIDDAGSTEVASISRTTHQLLPSLLGVSPDPEMGLIMGTALDSSGGEVEGAQVVVRDASRRIPTSLQVKYFVDDFPNRNQEATSADGYWLAINVPAGPATVEMYVSDGAGGHLLMGATEVEVFADSFVLSDIHTGYGDGVKLPDGCAGR